MESLNSKEVFIPNVDTSVGSPKIWLIKVPKYLAKSLKSAKPLQEIGRIRINTEDREWPKISLNLSEKMIKLSDDKENAEFVSIEHKFHIQEVDSHTMSIFSYNPLENKVTIEGYVEQKGEFRPIVSTNYINLHKQRNKQKTEPLRKTQQLDRTVTVFMPAVNTLKDKKKKVSPIKKFKKDRESVRNMLFELFEKHQYYYMKDLERLTQQPVYYLKEVLREMSIYNTKNPHQYMWELRPEFRHYSKTKVSNN